MSATNSEIPVPISVIEVVDRDYTTLIADARVWPRDGVSKGPLINALADAIEALVKERDELKLAVNIQDRMAENYAAVELQRLELAAEVERLKLVHVGQARLAMLAVYLADVDDDEGTQAFYQEWVRAHDAALIESLADYLDRNFQDIPAWSEAYREGVRTDEWMRGAVRMTTGAVRWLRERARQVREGEA